MAKRLAYAKDGSYQGIDQHLGGIKGGDGVGVEAIDPEAYTKDELVALATERGVATSGSKQEIADRLNEAE